MESQKTKWKTSWHDEYLKLICAFANAQGGVTQRKIIDLMIENPKISAQTLSEKIKISKRNIEQNIKHMKKIRKIYRIGTPKNGY